MRTFALLKPLFITLLISLALVGCSKESKEHKQYDETEESLAAVAGPKKLQFVAIDQGQHHNYGNHQIEIFKITDELSWQTFWAALHKNVNPLPKAPAVDFNKDMIIAVLDTDNEKPLMNFAITDIEKMDGQLVVSVARDESGENCMTAMTVSQPYMLIRTAIQPDELKLVVNSKTVDCV